MYTWAVAGHSDGEEKDKMRHIESAGDYQSVSNWLSLRTAF